ncbi:hypothetical protein BG006_006167 [Podila minutissima]|uniref:Uncharacterized protein n=1 Tax=Podila minutissima TaxID=64525 RepID=A0A9P5VL88_9FUNG|nr:hypothetical protein BG006_006167 [Podila minutissima]
MFTLDLEEVDAAILQQLESLLLKIESRLRSIETPAASFSVDNTLSRLRESFNSIEMPSIKDKVQATSVIMGETYNQAVHAKMCLSEQLWNSFEILEDKYVELEHSSFEKMDDALDLLQKVDHRAILDYTLDRLDCHRKAAIAGAKRHLRFEELPEQWQHNKYILSGYRFLSSNYECFRSIFYIHNESGNIWTHLVGFFYFLVVGIYFFFSGSNPYLSRPPTEDALIPFVPADGYDKLIFLVYFMAVYKCLLMSSLWHTFAHIAHKKTMRRMACLDYVGISVLMAASGVVTEFYGIYCDSFFRNTYIMATGVFETRMLRIMFFVSMAASTLLPIFYLFVTHGAFATLQWLFPLMKEIGCYVVGVVFYANQYPERAFPGMFDHLGSSHQVWHLCVLGGVYFNFMAAVHFWEQHHEFGCFAQP